MQYRNLGSTGCKVSEICLGTMTFGSHVPKDQAIGIINRALDHGVNFIDTADVYAGQKSEEVVGKALKGKRHSVVLATKVAYRTGPGVNDAGLSRKHIMQAVEESLSRLGTDYIDVYYAHLPDSDTPIEETIKAFDDLVSLGKVRYVACSNFRAWRLSQALWSSRMKGMARFECIQIPYNLITRDCEEELLPLCSFENVSVCAYNPMAGGLLSGKHDADKPPTGNTRFGLSDMGAAYCDRYWSDVNFKAVEALKTAARESNCSMPQFALAWVLQQSEITAVAIGVTSVTQLEENLGAADVKIPPEVMEKCDQVWGRISPPRFHYASLKLVR